MIRIHSISFVNGALPRISRGSLAAGQRPSIILAGSVRRSRPDRANFETTIADLMAGQHCKPLRVIMFNPETNRSEDVSHAVAQELLRRLGVEGRLVPRELEDFIDRHVGNDRQLTLRLA